MHAQFSLAIKGDQHGNGDQAAGMTRQPGAGPDLAPGIAADKVLKLFIQRGELTESSIHMCVPQDRPAYLNTLLITLFILHDYGLLKLIPWPVAAPAG
ncbi:hypothetical protein D3C71_1709970 [compost metagenome]